MGFVKHARTCPRFSKINQQHLWERLSFFVYLLHVVTHPWKLQSYHVALVGYYLACPKFFEVTNHQYLWKGLSDFVDFCKSLFASCEISIEATIICYFGLALSGIASQPIRLSDVLNVTQKRYEVSSWFFASIEARRNIVLFWVMIPKFSWAISLQEFSLLACFSC